MGQLGLGEGRRPAVNVRGPLGTWGQAFTLLLRSCVILCQLPTLSVSSHGSLTYEMKGSFLPMQQL